MPRAPNLATLALALLLGACTVTPAPVAPLAGDMPFPVCHGQGCRHLDQVRLTPDQWQWATAPLATPASAAAAERAALAETVRRFEVLTGEATGTSADLAGTFPGTGKPGQLDCLDEAANVQTYLRLLAGAGLLRHHVPAQRVHRGFFVFGWPHSAAAVVEQASGRAFVVDAWFHPHGAPPEVVTLDVWKSGWVPEQNHPPSPDTPRPPPATAAGGPP